MPRATIWIKEKNFDEWQKIGNKSAWINQLIELKDDPLTEADASDSDSDV